MKRRKLLLSMFAGGFGAASSSAHTPLAMLVPSNAPVIRGDGIHDDTAGLQAWLNGEPFRLAGAALAGGFIVGDTLKGGRYLLSSTLIGDAMPHRRVMMNCHLDGRNIPAGLGMVTGCRVGA